MVGGGAVVGGGGRSRRRSPPRCRRAARPRQRGPGAGPCRCGCHRVGSDARDTVAATLRARRGPRRPWTPAGRPPRASPPGAGCRRRSAPTSEPRGTCGARTGIDGQDRPVGLTVVELLVYVAGDESQPSQLGEHVDGRAPLDGGDRPGLRAVGHLEGHHAVGGCATAGPGLAVQDLSRADLLVVGLCTTSRREPHRRQQSLGLGRLLADVSGTTSPPDPSTPTPSPGTPAPAWRRRCGSCSNTWPTATSSLGDSFTSMIRPVLHQQSARRVLREALDRGNDDVGDSTRRSPSSMATPSPTSATANTATIPPMASAAARGWRSLSIRSQPPISVTRPCSATARPPR